MKQNGGAKPAGARSRRRAAAALAIAIAVIAAVLAAVLLSSNGSPPSRSTASPQPTSPQPASPQPTSPQPASPQPTSPQATAPTTTQVPTGQIEVGVNVNRLFNDRTYTQGEIDAQLAAIAATGVRTVRSDALWELAQPAAPPTGAAPSYDWRFDDEIARSLAGHGLGWLPILDYSPAWASSAPQLLHAYPRDPATFAAFARAFAERYDEPVYEIWNEPDSTSFAGPTPDPAAYAVLYETAVAAIHQIRPAARVLIGGLTRPATFIPALLAARSDLAGQIGGVAVHPYGSSGAEVVAKLIDDRRLLDAEHLGRVPLYVTEFGWTTSPPGAHWYLPSAARAAAIGEALRGIRTCGCGIAAAYLYTWVTPDRRPRDDQDWYGIATDPAAVAALEQATK